MAHLPEHLSAPSSSSHERETRQTVGLRREKRVRDRAFFVV
jgi:hypothetical protein